MNSKQVNSGQLGISIDELNEIISSSKSAEKIDQYNGKLQNCDLSGAAIELVDENDLSSIKEITSDLLKTYPNQPTGWSNKKAIAITSGVLLILATVFFLIPEKDIVNADNKSEKINLVKETRETASSTSNEVKKELTAESRTTTPVVKKQPIKESINQTIPIQPTEDKKTTIKAKEKDSLIKVNKSGKRKNQLDESSSASKTTNENKPLKTSLTARKREVRAITAMKAVDPKYKNQNYSLDALVDYYGGDKQLEKVLLTRLKGKIKDEDIPKNNSSVVFNFTVNSRGKIKEVQVQSIVAPNVKNLISEVVLNLTDWNKGDKRIPIDYTVYVTFK